MLRSGTRHEFLHQGSAELCRLHRQIIALGFLALYACRADNCLYRFNPRRAGFWPRGRPGPAQHHFQPRNPSSGPGDKRSPPARHRPLGMVVPDPAGSACRCDRPACLLLHRLDGRPEPLRAQSQTVRRHRHRCSRHGGRASGGQSRTRLIGRLQHFARPAQAEAGGAWRRLTSQARRFPCGAAARGPRGRGHRPGSRSGSRSWSRYRRPCRRRDSRRNPAGRRE